MSTLDRLLGTRELEMHHSAMSEPVTGRQRYERVLGGAFVLQHWTYDHPDFPDAPALLSDDRYHYFDVRGITRVFELEVDDAGWSMIRLDGDFSQRFTARFRGPEVMESTGEVSHDHGATWQPDFTMTYRRVEQEAAGDLESDPARGPSPVRRHAIPCASGSSPPGRP